MIGYAMLGTNDLDRALGFYTPLIKLLGGGDPVQHGSDRRAWFRPASGEGPVLGITRPYDGGEASFGNGSMLALKAATRDQIDAVHAKALELGAVDEGEPRLRETNNDGFYAAYFRDLDGNKICVYRMGQPD